MQNKYIKDTYKINIHKLSAWKANLELPGLCSPKSLWHGGAGVLRWHNAEHAYLPLPTPEP